MTCSLIKVMTSMALASCLACTPGAGEGDDGDSGSSSASTEPDGRTSTSVDPTVGPGTESSGATGSSSDPTVSSADGTTDAPACTLPPVEETVLDQLTIAAPGLETQVAAGDTQLSLLWIDDGTPTTVDACVEWSVAPVDGVSIDDTGRLTIDAAVPAGTVVSVTADVEAGRRVLMADLQVYVPVAYDIVGYWS